MRKAVSIAFGARSRVDQPRREERADDRVEVDQAETERHRHHQHEDLLDGRVAAVDRDAQTPVQPAQPRERQQQLDHRADQDRAGVDVQLPRLVSARGHAEDEPDDDREVPEDRRQRRHREVLVAVQDPDDDPGHAEQDDDREEDLRERRRQVVVGAREPNGHEQRREEHEERREPPPARAGRARRCVEATRQARRFSPFSSSSLKTGTNAEESAASATSARIRFGIWNATVNALIGPRAPK